MLKQILTLSLVLVAVFALQADQGGIITADRVNVRQAPVRDAKILKILAKNAKVAVMARYEKPVDQKAVAVKENIPIAWVQVRMGTTNVWVKGSYLDKNNTVKSDILNVRQGPGTQHTKVGEFKKGEVVKLTGNKKSDWVEVELGISGFIAAQYVKLTGKISEAEIAEIVGGKTQSKIVAPKQAVAVAEKHEVVNSAPEQKIEPKGAKTVEPSAKDIKIEGAKLEPVAPQEPKVESIVDEQPIPTEEVKVDSEKEIKDVAVKDEGPAPKPVEKKKLITIERKTEIISEDEVGNLETNVVEFPSNEESFTEVTDEEALEQQDVEPRVIRREGIVAPSGSPAAPSPYTLRNFENGWRMNFLYIPRDSEIKLKKYLGKKVVITGTESIDSRWKDRPLLNIETIELYSGDEE